MFSNQICCQNTITCMYNWYKITSLRIYYDGLVEKKRRRKFNNYKMMRTKEQKEMG